MERLLEPRTRRLSGGAEAAFFLDGNESGSWVELILVGGQGVNTRVLIRGGKHGVVNRCRIRVEEVPDGTEPDDMRHFVLDEGTEGSIIDERIDVFNIEGH